MKCKSLILTFFIKFKIKFISLQRLKRDYESKSNTWKFKKELSENEYENYIAILKFNEKQSKADFLVFNAPNELLAKFIQTKYGKKISHFYEVQSGNKASVLIQAQSQKHSNKSTKIDIAHIKAQSTILNPSLLLKAL